MPLEVLSITNRLRTFDDDEEMFGRVVWDRTVTAFRRV